MTSPHDTSAINSVTNDKSTIKSAKAPRWSNEEDCLLLTVFPKVGQPHETRSKKYSWQDAANEMNEEVASRGRKARRFYTSMMVTARWKQLQKESEETLDEEGFDLGDEPKGYVTAETGCQETKSLAYQALKAKREIKSKKVTSKEANLKNGSLGGID